MSKIIKIFIFTISLLFGFMLSVKATPINLGTPLVCMAYYEGSYPTKCGNATLVNSYYYSPYLLQKIELSPITSAFNYQFPNADLCKGQDMVFVGDLIIEGATNYGNLYPLSISGIGNGSNGTCVFTSSNGVGYKFTCALQGGGTTIIQFDTNYYYGNSRGSWNIYFNRTVDITCAPNNSSVIESVQQMGQDIINNNNLNTQATIQKDNENTALIMNQMAQNQQQTNEGLENINDSLTNSDVDMSGFDSLSGNVAQNGVITQLFTMPITLYRAVLNSINGTCATVDLGSLYGTKLSMPCINPQTYLGSVWNVIDVLFSGLFIYFISKKFIQAFNNFSQLKEGDILD